MCGITGLFGFEHGYQASPERLRAMCDVMWHRGPDDEGLYCQGSIGLGMRRLKIIDLETGQQPITNEDGSVVVVFNGEIYNYPTLRRELLQKGHRFRTQSDTEVLVHLYEEQGEAFLQALNGMFAIALWDANTHTLILARDRFGEKPLHYTLAENTLIFASEMKSILCGLSVPPPIDPEAAYHYFLSHYIPAPLTIYQGIRKLLPGHYLRCNNGNVTEIKYWDFTYEPDETHNDAYFAEGLYDLLEDAVRLRLLSDVPLGAFLSGGVDSSIIVGLMSRMMDRPVQTFSIGFEDAQHDESPYAQRVAAAFGTEHHAQGVKASAMDWLQKLVWHCDEPFADSSALPTFLLCEMTRREVTVALSGDGSDELFGGYDRYTRMLRRRKWRLVPDAVRRQLTACGRRLPPRTRGKAFLQSLALDDYHFFCHDLRPLEAQDLLDADFLGQLGSPQPYRFAESYRLPSRPGEYLSPFMYYDAKVYLPDDILVKVDRMSMAHSLETRQPFLDHRLAEFVARIPARLKVRQRLGGSIMKYILKQSCRHLLPPETLRRRKHGFTLPVDQWFRHELRDMVLDLLSASHLQHLGVLNPQTVTRLVDEHLHGQRNHKEVLWACLVFVLWADSQPALPQVGAR